MAIVRDKVSGVRDTKGTTEARSNGKYYVFTDANDPLLLVDIKHLKEGVPHWQAVELDAAEKEAKDAEILIAQTAESEAKALVEYIELRKAEYPTVEELIVALWESTVEGRPESAAELQGRRMVVKAKIPKPLNIKE